MEKAIQEGFGGWILPEKIFMRFNTPYYVIAIILTIVLILVFGILGGKVPVFNSQCNMFDSIILSILIGYLLIGIQFLLNKFRSTFEDLGASFKNTCFKSELQHQIYRNFIGFRMYYYLVVLFILLPFISHKIIVFQKIGWQMFFSNTDPSYWGYILDIYNQLLSFISLYLLAIILWMIINVSLAFNVISAKHYRTDLKINLFDADKMGGLRPLRNLILLFSIYYFMLIILFVLSWLAPLNDSYVVLPYESKFLILIWMIGMAFFIYGWYSIRKLLSGKLENEVNHISDLCQLKTRQLSDLVSKDDSRETEKHLNQISNALDALHKERERMLKFSTRPMDIRTFLIFLSSSSPSLISILKTLRDVRELEPLIANNSQPIIDQLVNILIR